MAHAIATRTNKNTAVTKQAARPSAQRTPRKANIIANEGEWEARLDMMGTNKSPNEYQKHLERAPNPESAMAKYLRGFLAGAETAARA